MSQIPTFSVVIPLYNHRQYIDAALRSVLAQTMPAHEIIIVDDGSQDSGYELAEEILHNKPNATLVRQENRGAHHAINRAIELAKGSHVAVLNSDDMFEPAKLQRCSKLFLADPELKLVFGNVEIIDDTGRLVRRNETTEWLDRSRSFYHRHPYLPLALLNENFSVTTSNFVFSRELWEAAGGFKNLRYCHDLDFLMAAARYGKMLFDERGAAHIRYRVHPSNTIKETLEKVHLEIAAVIASALDDRTFDVDLAPDSKRVLLEDILERKGLAAKVGSLVPFRRLFEDREAFYDQISGNLSNVNADPAAHKVQTKKKPVPVNAIPVPKMVVAIELSNFDKGGLEKVVLDCAIDFRRCGINPIIISCGKIGHLGDVARGAGIETFALPEKEGDQFYEELLKSRKVDIAMSHFSTRGYRTFRKLRIPNITFIHNIYAMLRDQPLKDFLNADQFVDRYISVSSLATEYLVERYGFDRGKIDTIPNGLILDEHLARLNQPAADRRQFGVKDTDYLFINVASYNLHKNHYLMADAMRLIRRKRDDIKILCVGNVIYPPHIDQLRQDIEAWGLTEHMLMPGYFEDVAPLHKAADAFLLPSLIEGWSIAMNEAMFYGKPMILTETGGAPEAIGDSGIGLLVPNEYGAVTNLNSELLDRIGYEQRSFQTAPLLAGAMTRFADEREIWRDRGAKGRERIMQEFDFSSVTNKYVAVCQQVLKCAR